MYRERIRGHCKWGERIFSLALCAVLLLGQLSPALTALAAGEGTQPLEADISWYVENKDSWDYEITTEAELRGLAMLVNGLATEKNDFSGVTIALMGDVALNGVWVPIGTAESPFRGNFNGNGHTISGLLIDGSAVDVRVTGGAAPEPPVAVESLPEEAPMSEPGEAPTSEAEGPLTEPEAPAIAENEMVELEEQAAPLGAEPELLTDPNMVTVPASTQYAGLFGYVGGSLTNLTVSGEVNCPNTVYVGGIVGYLNGEISDCVNRCTVIGKETSEGDFVSCAGGVVGQRADGREITRCGNSGAVSGPETRTGGVVGYAEGWTAITSCYQISGAGGGAPLMGSFSDASLTSSFVYQPGGTTSAAAFNGFSPENCYFNAESADEETGARTDEQFKNGEIAWLLNNDSDPRTPPAFGQGTNYPVFADAEHPHIVKLTLTEMIPDDDMAAAWAENNFTSILCPAGAEVRFQVTFQTEVPEEELLFAGKCEVKFVEKSEKALTYAATAGETDMEVRYYFESKADPDTIWYLADPSAEEFTVTTAEQLFFLAKVSNGEAEGVAMDGFYGKTIYLGSDVNLNDAPWTPIGKDGFGGVFDGGGHTISGLYIDSEEDNQGLFGVMNSGLIYPGIKNLTVEGQVTSIGSNVGGIVGNSQYATIINCVNKAAVTGNSAVGGIAGTATFTDFIGCVNTGAVTGSSLVGGLVGDADELSTVTSCYQINPKEGGHPMVGSEEPLAIKDSFVYTQGGATAAGVFFDTAENCYFNAAEEKPDTGARTNAQFAGGEVAWLLNGGETQKDKPAFGQGADYPVLADGTHSPITVRAKLVAAEGLTVAWAGGGLVAYGAEEDTVTFKVTLTDGSNFVEITPANIAQYVKREENVFTYTVTLTAENLTLTCSVITGILPDTSWYTAAPSVTTFTLTTAEQLAGLARLVNGDGEGYEDVDGEKGVDFKGKTILLGHDIDLGRAHWTPIGRNNSVPFSGTFDGAGHAVSGLNIPSGEENLGLFGYALNAVIQNLTVRGSVSDGMDTGGEYIGGLAGQLVSSKVSSYVNEVTIVSKSSRVGGVAGSMAGSGSQIADCVNKSAVQGVSLVGGIVGEMKSGNITRLSNEGSVKGFGNNSEQLGGIVGRVADAANGTVLDTLTNTGEISGAVSVGGLVGYYYAYSSKPQFTNFSNAGAVTAIGNNAGGILGTLSTNYNFAPNTPFVASMEAEPMAAFGAQNTGAVTGNYNVGGLIGRMIVDSTIALAAADMGQLLSNAATVTGSSNVGGLVGGIAQNGSCTVTITAAQSSGKVVAAANNAGGIVGQSDAKALNINQASFTGAVERQDGSAGIGALVGSGKDILIDSSFSYMTENPLPLYGSTTGVLSKATNSFYLADAPVSDWKGTAMNAEEFGSWRAAWLLDQGQTNYTSAWAPGASYPIHAAKRQVLRVTLDVRDNGLTGSVGLPPDDANHVTVTENELPTFYVTSGSKLAFPLTDFPQTVSVEFTPAGSAEVAGGKATVTATEDLTLICDFIPVILPEFTWYTDAQPGGPYTLTTEADLIGFKALVEGTAPELEKDNFKDKTVFLADDLALTTRAACPIGTSSSPFCGTFEGDGATVSGMNLLSPGGFGAVYLGFFGYLKGATVRNLTVSGSIVGQNTGEVVGGIAAMAMPGTMLENCISQVDITGVGTAGGIVGKVLSSFGASGNLTLAGCVNSGGVSASGYAGGLVGQSAVTADISKCGNSGAITSSSTAAGLVAELARGSSLTACFNIGAINGMRYVCGLAGVKNGATQVTLTGCYNSGNIIDDSKMAEKGALVSTVEGVTFDHCYYLNTIGLGFVDADAERAVTATQFAGGEAAYLLNLGGAPAGRLDCWRQGGVVPTLCAPGEGAIYRVTVADGVTVPSPYVAAGGTLTLTVTPPIGMAVEQLTVLDKDGKTVRSYSGAGGDITLTMPASDLTVTVLYTAAGTPGQKYTVSFDAAGGTPAPAAQKILWGERAAEPSAPGKAATEFYSYHFRGWYTAPTGGEKWSFDRAVRADMTFYARWEAESLVTGGTEEEPFPIESKVALEFLASEAASGETFEGSYFTLSETLVLTNWSTPIGTEEHPFLGSFDGKGNTVELGNSPASLFGSVGENGQVSNMTLTAAPATVPAEGYSPIAQSNGGAISDCSVVLDLSAAAAAGGSLGNIAGVVLRNDGTVENSAVKLTLTATNGTKLTGVGGVVYANTGTIRDCTLEEGSVISGVFGGELGGIAATMTAGEVENCQNQGVFNGKAENGDAVSVGGVVGSFSGSVKDCANSGTITLAADIPAQVSQAAAGGILGRVSGNADIQNCVNRATVYGHFVSGGIVATDAGTVNPYPLTITGCRTESKGASRGRRANNEQGNIGGGPELYCDYAGGIAGYLKMANNLRIEHCENRQSVYVKPTSVWGYAGGILGYGNSNDSGTREVLDSANHGAVSGNIAGGIAGDFSKGWVKSSENRGQVSAYFPGLWIRLGGIVADGEVSDCANYGDIVVGDPEDDADWSGAKCWLGGVSAYTSDTIQRCFSRGSIRQYGGTVGAVGGLVGELSTTTPVDYVAKDSYVYGDAPIIPKQKSNTPYAGTVVGKVDGPKSLAGCYVGLAPTEGQLPDGMVAVVTDSATTEPGNGIFVRTAKDFTGGKVAYEMVAPWGMGVGGLPALNSARAQKATLSAAGGNVDCKLTLTPLAEGYEGLAATAAESGEVDLYAPPGKVTVICAVPKPFTQRDEKGIQYRYEYTVGAITAKTADGASVPVQSGDELELTEGLRVEAVFALNKAEVPDPPPEPEPDPKPDPKPEPKPEPDPGQGNGQGAGTDDGTGDGAGEGTLPGEGGGEVPGGTESETPTEGVPGDQSGQAEQPAPEGGQTSTTGAGETTAKPQPPVELAEVENPPVEQPVDIPTPPPSQEPEAPPQGSGGSIEGLDPVEPDEEEPKQEEEKPATLFEVVRKAVEENPAILVATGGGLAATLALAGWFRYRRYKKE